MSSSDKKIVTSWKNWAEPNRLGGSSPSVTITKDNLPKPGDKVRCLPGFTNKGDDRDENNAGTGYQSGKIITVKYVTGENERRAIIWPEDGGNGIYHNALEYVYY